MRKMLVVNGISIVLLFAIYCDFAVAAAFTTHGKVFSMRVSKYQKRWYLPHK